VSADGFVIEYKPIINEDENEKEKEKEEQKEKWNSIELKNVKEKENENENEKENENEWEYCIDNLQMNTKYGFRIKPHSKINDCFSTFSDLVICQTENLSWSYSLLSYESKRINDSNNVVLENNNTLIRKKSDEYVSVSLPKVNEVSQGIHCWRFKIWNQSREIEWIVIGMANSNKTFKCDSYCDTELFCYNGYNQYERNDSVGNFMTSCAQATKWNSKKRDYGGCVFEYG